MGMKRVGWVNEVLIYSRLLRQGGESLINHSIINCLYWGSLLKNKDGGKTSFVVSRLCWQMEVYCEAESGFWFHSLFGLGILYEFQFSEAVVVALRWKEKNITIAIGSWGKLYCHQCSLKLVSPPKAWGSRGIQNRCLMSLPVGKHHPQNYGEKLEPVLLEDRISESAVLLLKTLGFFGAEWVGFLQVC